MNLIRVAQKAFIRNKENKILLIKFSKYLPDKKIWGTWDIRKRDQRRGKFESETGSDSGNLGLDELCETKEMAVSIS
jgi:hypothetical protein